MNVWTLYHNPNCSKSRKSKEILEKNNINFKVIEYLKNPLAESELIDIMEMLTYDYKEIVRTNETDFINDPFDLISKETIAKKLSKNSSLQERPIIVATNKAVIARPIERLTDFLELYSQ